MTNFTPILVRSKPGIKRDGTGFEGDNYVDGQWVRFQRGLPRKMQGYRMVTDYLAGISRGLFLSSKGGYAYAHSGWSDGLEGFTIDNGGFPSTLYDRTPAGFTADDNNRWQLDSMYNAAALAENQAIIAHAAPNLLDIDSAVEMPVYYGDMYAQDVLVTTGQSVSGGACVIHPYLFTYGSFGQLSWSDVNQPTIFTGGDSGTARPVANKILKGIQSRGGAPNAPAGLFWAVDSLIKASFVGGAAIFAFDVISDECSVLSSSGIIELDGLFYWAGVDRFLMFNGVIRELPNQMNINFFFDNLNWRQRQKVFAFKVPRWGEIWWCFPYGSGTNECNHAVIYNAREQTWYDTVLPDDGRSAAFYAQSLRYPVMTGVTETDNGFEVWQHETGTDRIRGRSRNAIKSYFETADISKLTSSSPTDQAIHVEHVEPDFIQSGDMKLNVTGSLNARSGDIVGPDKTFGPNTEIVEFKEERRWLRFRFESNTVGGDYQMGDTVAIVGDGTRRYRK